MEDRMATCAKTHARRLQLRSALRVVGDAGQLIGALGDSQCGIREAGLLSGIQSAQFARGQKSGVMQNFGAQIVADAGQKALIQQQVREASPSEAWELDVLQDPVLLRERVQQIRAQAL